MTSHLEMPCFDTLRFILDFNIRFDIRVSFDSIRHAVLPQSLKYGVTRLETLPLSSRLLRELHERLMDQVRGNTATPGQIRQSQNWIGPAGCTLRDES